MKRFVFVVAAGVLLAGCADNKTRIGEGAGLGGLLGAAAGGIIGHQSGHGIEGALIGGAVGAAGGAAVGSQMPKEQTTTTTTTATSTVSTHVTIKQIVDWSKAGVSSDEIIAKITTSNSTYALTEDDIAYLRSNGVSERVIETMMSSR